MRISIVALVVALGAAGYLHRNSAAQPAAEAGKKSFETRCAPCDAGDGKGGERGPNILVSGTVRRRPAEALGELITRGVPAGGMPAVSLPRAELDALVAFVRALAAPARENPPAGNVEAGEAFFFGKGECGSCHSVRGRGGIRGPDLSDVGSRRTVAEIERSLREPDSEVAPGFKTASVRLRDGRRLRGFIKNESNYDLQLQSLDGLLASLRASEIAEVSREPGSLMPRLEASAEEFRDLAAYLSRLDEEGARGAERRPPLLDTIPFAEVAQPRP